MKYKRSLEQLAFDYFPPVLVTALAALILLGCAGDYWKHRIECSNYGEIARETVAYSYVNGCYVQRDNRWISLNAALNNTRDISVEVKK